MSRHLLHVWARVLIVTTALSGCAPTQPFFLHEDGDLSHYLDVATAIDYPDVNQAPLPDAAQTQRPLTTKHPTFEQRWKLSLEEAVSIALQNSQTIRSLGQVRRVQPVGTITTLPPESLTLNPDFQPSIYDPAIQETSNTGVEAALANFDTQLRSAFTFDRTDRPQNTTTLDTSRLDRNLMNWQTELAKRTASGSQLAFRNVTTYDKARGFNSLRPFRPFEIEWNTAFEAEVRHPLLRSSGVQFNRTAVVLARINTDISLADFERAARDFLLEVERAYWNLYFHYRAFESAKTGRDSAHATWERIYTQFRVGGEEGGAGNEAQARSQYYFFRSRLEQALSELYDAENRLRFLMGIGATDGRLIEPTDEPTTARVEFDWLNVRAEALTRSPDVRRQKWRIKQSELQLAAARNQLLPQFDAIALYRWLEFDYGGGFQPEFAPTPDKFQARDLLQDGTWQEWRLGFEFSVPLGVRAEMAAVRNQQLQLQRAKSRLQDLELEVTHQLTTAVRRLHDQYQIAQTSYNRQAAARDQVEANQTAFEVGTVPLDFLLEAQRNQAEAEVEYHRALTEYNLAIVEVHFNKGSLMEYNGVALAEGPWPVKAYVDAQTRARQRDASYYMDYTFTRPAVVSQGTVPQRPGAGAATRLPGTQAPACNPTAESVDVLDFLDQALDGESAAAKPLAVGSDGDGASPGGATSPAVIRAASSDEGHGAPTTAGENEAGRFDYGSLGGLN
jgi:outer membrane protein TolC